MININNLFSIGEFSKIKNVSVDTLRYYDKIGLLKPEVVDKYTSYRYYSYAQLMKYDIIKFFRSVDMSLNEISKLFKEGNAEVLKESLYTQRQVLYDKTQEMLSAISTVDNIYKGLEFFQEARPMGCIYYKEIPERKIACSKISNKTNTNSDWYSEAYGELTKRLKEEEIVCIYQGGFIHKMDQLTIEESTVFEELNERALEYSNNTIKVPGGQYLCMNFSETTRDKYMDSYLQVLKENNLSPDHLIQVYMISGSFNVMDRNFEIQCLIKEQPTVK